MNHIGIMQGRLVPPTDDRIQCFPRDNWESEFKYAAMAGLDCIEWIYDEYGADINPISSDAGIKKMQSLSSFHGVQILSLCADYFMEKPMIRASKLKIKERSEVLTWLIHRCQEVGINRIVLPFVDASRIDNNEEMDILCKVLEPILMIADTAKIEIHLETSLNPIKFAELLSNLSHQMLKVNYDSGNSSSLGYKPEDEFNAYGKHIGSVHIKDRIYGGGTVELEKGDTDFPSLFDCLNKINYTGDYILQVAREIPGDEVNLAKKNRAFVVNHLEQRN